MAEQINSTDKHFAEGHTVDFGFCGHSYRVSGYIRESMLRLLGQNCKSRDMQRNLTFLALTVCVAIGTCGVLMWIHGPDTPIVQPAVLDNAQTDEPGDRSESADSPLPLTESGEAYQKLRSLKQAEAKLEFLRALRNEPWLEPSSTVLIRAMDSSEPDEVQALALDISLELAVAGDGTKVPDVLRRGIDSPNPPLRRYALVKCRSLPRQELVPDLLTISRTFAQENFLALDALAEIADPRCGERIYEIASDANSPKTLRYRAISLLGKVRHPEGLELLVELSNSDDESMRVLAREAIKVYRTQEGD